MVSVHVGDENLCFPMKAYASLNHLPLDTFAAVEEEEFIFSSNCDGWQSSLRSWYASSGSEEDYT